MISVNEIKSYVEREFSSFGVNKKREVSRLIYEIAKRDNCSVDSILGSMTNESQNFSELKTSLLKQRYPKATEEGASLDVVLPELDIDEGNKIDIRAQPELIPRNIYIEEEIEGNDFIARLKQRFPDATYSTISNYADHIRGRDYGIADYNDRLNSFYFIKERYDFFKPCACAKKTVHCGYHVVNLGSGCAFECEYCYLQDYINSPGIVLPANLDNFFEAFKSYKQNINVGSGETTDSLVFDHITEYSPRIVDFFRHFPQSRFEFKTKSDNIDLLFTVEPSSNIVISWTLSPAVIADTIEHYTASLERRLKAAQRCAKAGYTVSFHLDPIIYFDGWQNEYCRLIDQIFETIPSSRIGWISIGTLRMTPRLKKIIENRFPSTTLLNGELFRSYDGKLRYSPRLRQRIYMTIKEYIESKDDSIYLYLCMEEKAMCESAQAAPLRPYRKK